MYFLMNSFGSILIQIPYKFMRKNFIMEDPMDLTTRKSSTVSPFSRSRIEDEFASFQKEMNSLMNSFFNRGEISTPQLFNSSFYPAIDLKEKDNKYMLDADVPGINEGDIDIDLHDNILTIKGESKTEKETKESGYMCVERSHGAFRRDVYLDEEVDQSSVKAELKNGVLHVELTKKEPSKTNHKKIPIKH